MREHTASQSWMWKGGPQKHNRQRSQMFRWSSASFFKLEMLPTTPTSTWLFPVVNTISLFSRCRSWKTLSAQLERSVSHTEAWHCSKRSPCGGRTVTGSSVPANLFSKFEHERLFCGSRCKAQFYKLIRSTPYCISHVEQPPYHTVPHAACWRILKNCGVLWIQSAPEGIRYLCW